MAKVKKRQQGFQLPEEVIKWLDYEEYVTGASLSRLALAAFCCLIDHDVDSNEYMRAAMRVERGDWSFLDMSWRRWDEFIDDRKQRIASLKEAGKSTKHIEEDLKDLVERQARKKYEMARVVQILRGFKASTQEDDSEADG